MDFHRDLDLLRNYTGLYSTELFTAEALSIVHKHNLSEVSLRVLSNISSQNCRQTTHLSEVNILYY